MNLNNRSLFVEKKYDIRCLFLATNTINASLYTLL